MVLKRDMGKLKFLTLRDGSGDLQLVCNQADLEPELFALLDEVDLGDIVAATGPVGTTRRGESLGLRRSLGDADEVAPSAAREVGTASRTRTCSSGVATSI